MRSLLLPVLLVCSFNLTAQAKNGQEPYMTKSLSGEAVKEVEAETSGGNIIVTGGSSTESRVEVFVRSNNRRNGEDVLSKEEIQKRLDENYNLDVSVDHGKVTAKAKPKHNKMDWKRALSISFRVYVPQDVTTDLITSGGNIELTSLSGMQKFTTSGGNLQLDNISGKSRGRTSGGNIVVKNSKDDLDLSTSGGNIEATDCNGTLSLETSGGNLRLNNLNGTISATTSGGNVHGESIVGSLKAFTSGGNVRLRDMSCKLETATSGGQIDVALKDVKNPVHIVNNGGNISLQLPKGAGMDLDLYGHKVENIKLDSFSGSVQDDRIRGKLNGGGALISVSAGSGQISLSFQ